MHLRLIGDVGQLGHFTLVIRLREEDTNERMGRRMRCDERSDETLVSHLAWLVDAWKEGPSREREYQHRRHRADVFRVVFDERVAAVIIDVDRLSSGGVIAGLGDRSGCWASMVPILTIVITALGACAEQAKRRMCMWQTGKHRSTSKPLCMQPTMDEAREDARASHWLNVEHK